MNDSNDIFKKLEHLNNPDLFSPNVNGPSNLRHPTIIRASDLYPSSQTEIPMSHQTTFVCKIPTNITELANHEKIKNDWHSKKSSDENQSKAKKTNDQTPKNNPQKITKTGDKHSQNIAHKTKNKRRSQSTQPEAHVSFVKKIDAPKIIMINEIECFKVSGKPSQFVYENQITLSENCKTEFKTFIKGDFKYGTQNTFYIILKYICSFLNSFGGTMYLGIKDDGTVTGVEVSHKIQKDFEEFINLELDKFHPHVHPWQVDIQYHNIMIPGNKLALFRRKIVQINVLCHHFNQLYVTGNDEIHIRRAASTNNLIPVEIVHLLKLRNNPLLTNQSLMGSLNLKMFEELSAEDLKEIIENTQNTLLEARYYQSKNS